MLSDCYNDGHQRQICRLHGLAGLLILRHLVVQILRGIKLHRSFIGRCGRLVQCGLEFGIRLILDPCQVRKAPCIGRNQYRLTVDGRNSINEVLCCFAECRLCIRLGCGLGCGRRLGRLILFSRFLGQLFLCRGRVLHLCGRIHLSCKHHRAAKAAHAQQHGQKRRHHPAQVFSFFQVLLLWFSKQKSACPHRAGAGRLVLSCFGLGGARGHFFIV